MRFLGLHHWRRLDMLRIVRLVSCLTLIARVIVGEHGLRWRVLIVPTTSRCSCWQRHHSERGLLLWHELLGLSSTCWCEARDLDLRVVGVLGAWRWGERFKRRLLLLVLPSGHTCWLVMGHWHSLVIVMKCLLTKLAHLWDRRIIPVRSWLHTLTHLSSYSVVVRCL